MFTWHKFKGTRSRWSAKRKKVSMVFASLAVFGLIGAGTYVVSNNHSTNLPAVKVKRGPVTIKITEIGELRAQDQVTISAANDKLILWLAPEGKWVEEGDTLAVFESEKYLIARGEASSTVAVARAELMKAQSELEAQRTKEEGARQNYASLAELAKKGYVMESEVEQARLSHIELKSKTRSFQAAVDAAGANVERARRAVSQQDRKLREGVVVAPRAGLVVYATTGDAENVKKISVGMTPFQGMDLMYLPDVSTIMVDAEISEVDLARIKVGQPAEIRLDAYGDAVFRGEVSYIADLAKRKISRVTGKMTGAKVFDVTIKVLDHDIRLKPGLTATVDVIVNEYPDALYVPLEAIFIDERDQAVVYAAKRNKMEPRPYKQVGVLAHVFDQAKTFVAKKEIIVSQSVVMGESNDRIAVILEGVQEGQMIFLVRPPSAAEEKT